MPRKGWSTMEVPSGWLQVIRGPRPRSVPVASCVSAAPSEPQIQPRPPLKQNPVVKTSGTRPFGDPQSRVSAAKERVAKLEAALSALHCGGPRSRGFARNAQACEGGEGAAGGRADQRVRRIPLASPVASDRVGCEEGHSEREHPRGRTAAHSAQTHAAVHPTSTSRHGRRIAPVASDDCPDEGAGGRSSNGGGSSTQAHLQARRFRPHVCGRVAGMDRRETGRFERGTVGGETRRNCEDQQHHVSGRTTVATRSGIRTVAIHGVEQCQLRATYGLRGVRVGEASNPGPVQTRQARRRFQRSIPVSQGRIFG